METNIGAKGLVVLLVAVLAVLLMWSGITLSAGENTKSEAASSTGKGAGRKPKLDVPYEPTAYEIATEMLRMADVRKDDLVYDLGCGDGRIVIMAAKDKGARGIGIDIDPERIKESEESAKKAGVSDRVHFFRQDLFKTDIKSATVVMLYLWPEVNLRLRPKLLADLKPGTRVVSHSHTMGDWKPDQVSEVSNHTLYFWVIPANVTGTWEWLMPTDKGNSRALLRLSQHFQEVSGSLTLDNAAIPLTSASLTGDRLHLVAEQERGGRKITIEFDGRARGDTIRGTVLLSGDVSHGKIAWNARRDPSGKVPLDK